MSAVEEDYENALWNNSFYSLLGGISLLLLSHHIVNLKRTVNIPNLMLTTLVSAGLMDPHDAGMVESRPSTKRTSLMRVSPSMKALDNVLNEKLPASAVPNVILEEDAVEELEQESPSNSMGKLADVAIYCNLHGQPLNSVQTFHTAKSSDAVESAPGSQLHQEKAAPHRRSSSISTIGESGYSTNESTPRLHEPAAFYTVKHTSKDFSPQLKSMTTSFPEKEVDSGDTKVVDSEHEESLQEEKISNLDQSTLGNHSNRKHVASMLDAPGMKKVDTKSNEDTKRNGATNSNIINDRPRQRNASAPQLVVKSMLDALDSPRLEEPFRPKPAVHAPDHSRLKSQSSAFATPRSQITTMSPYTGTAGQSPTVSIHKRSNTMSDIGTLKKGTISELSPEVKSTNGSSSTVSSSAGSKRFSFRGMFKNKSKNHSLDKLGEVKEDMEPSKPSKITAKSFSTPNFAGFKLKTEKADKPQKPQKSVKETRKGFFTGRRKSEVELTAFRVESPKSQKFQSLENDTTPQKAPIAVAGPEAAFAGQKSSPPTSAPKQILPPYPPAKVEEPTPRTPATIYSATSQFTPITADLNPNTIREVDDLDYLPAFDQTDDFESETENGKNGYMKRSTRKGVNLNATNDHKEKDPGEKIDHFGDPHDESEEPDIYDSPKRRSPGSFGEELKLDVLRMPLDPESTSTIFGSPFAVSYSPSSMRSPRKMHPTQTLQNQTLPPPVDILRSRSPKAVDLLLGDALFPKSLSAQEVESIVSLERSRSMRSIKSNGKRSSFINYMGSDENIVVGDNLLGVSFGTMGRSASVRSSGSILKKSLSSQSLGPEQVQLLDAAMDVDINEEFNNELNSPNIDVSIHDFIEFSDFIDVDNLDFTTSPTQFDAPSPIVADHGFVPVKIDFGENPESQPLTDPQPLLVTELQPLPEFEHANPDKIADTRADISAEFQPEIAPLSEETAIRPEVVIVDSDITPEAEDPPTPPHSLHSPHQDSLKSPILNTAYSIAMSQTRESPGTTARPVSMSFKGFSGSAFKNKQVVQSGSHQLVNLYNDSSNESLAVGKGFGSSEEDSDDDDDYSFDDENANLVSSRPSKVSSSPALKQNETLTNKRQPAQPSNKFLSLQPPPSLSGPFHHDRIPSLSDHSAASSPRLLTSFISRIKRSPMSSPKMTFGTKSGVRFSSRIVLYDTYNCDEYDRHPDIATCNQLTPALAQQIKDELNEFKAEMHIHRDSQCYTHFF